MKGLLALGLLLAAGCAGGALPRPAPVHDAAPWEIPESFLHTQRLYRVHYSGPEGEGSFRVTLRLAVPERYQLQAVDPVGRSLWSLDVDQNRGLFLNHRSRSSCIFEGSFALSGVSLGPFPLLALPTLLVGRLPAQPAAPPQMQGGQVSFRDGANRLWTAVVGSDGVLASWNMKEGAGPSLLWVRSEGWAILSDRERDVQVRWREVLGEKAEGELTALQVPAGYREGPCREPDLPGSEEQEPPGR